MLWEECAYRLLRNSVGYILFEMTAGRLHMRPPVPRPVSTLAGALWDEYAAIHGKPRIDSDAHGPQSALDAYYKAASAENQTALCLSGGGIRSAAFSLGVLQEL